MARRDPAAPLPTRSGGRLRIRTETGSVYEATRDGAGARWARTHVTLASGVLGMEGGRLAGWPLVMPGYRAELRLADDDESGASRVLTSRVVEVLEGEAAEPLVGGVDGAGLAPGDMLARDLAGVLVALPYLGVRDGLVYAGFGPSLAWTFDAATGAEVDDELGWGPAHGRTGSSLVGVWRGAIADRAAEAEAAWARVAASAQAVAASAPDSGDTPGEVAEELP